MIPVYKPSIHAREIELVNDCLTSGWISSRGKYVQMFESQLADYIDAGSSGKGRVVSCSNGTVALHLAMLALGIGQGDEVIVPSFTYIATSNCVEYVGATPVFADCNEDDWNLSICDVKRLITPKTKAIIFVHLYGIPADLSELREMCDHSNIFLIEDCAESLGASINNVHCGRAGHISTFSFFGNKTITTGEGGAIYTQVDALYSRALRLKSQGLAESREYWHDMIGYNFRMTNICAAIGCAQLERIGLILERKRHIDSYYRAALSEYPVQFQLINDGISHSAWMTAFILESEEIRDELRSYLRDQSIETRPTFFPIHTMPMYSSSFRLLPVTDRIARSGLNLPSFPDISKSELQYIVDSIKRFLG